MELTQRYERNRSTISPAEQERLRAAHVLVLGCGGLGGYVIEFLSRIGVGHLRVVDGDVFCPSNLNRQLFSTEQNLGVNKARVAAERVHAINSGVAVEAVEAFADETNLPALLEGQDLVVDALDTAPARLLAARLAGEKGIPMVHGAICGWSARVHTLLPGDEIMEFLCGGGSAMYAAGNLPFTASLCASIEAAEAVKLLLHRGTAADKRLIEIDLHALTFDRIEL